MFGKIYHLWGEPLTIKADGRFKGGVGKHLFGELSCVKRVVLPPMGKCNGNIEIKIEGATTVPSYSPNRYTFEFPASSATGDSYAITSFEYEQCVILGKNSNPRVTVTSNGIPVDVRGDIEIGLKTFNCFDRSKTSKRMWMRDIESKMKGSRDDARIELKIEREEKERLEIMQKKEEKERRDIRDGIYMAYEKAGLSRDVRGRL